MSTEPEISPECHLMRPKNKKKPSQSGGQCVWEAPLGRAFGHLGHPWLVWYQVWRQHLVVGTGRSCQPPSLAHGFPLPPSFQQLLCYDPSQRLSAKAALMHPYFWTEISPGPASWTVSAADLQTSPSLGR